MSTRLRIKPTGLTNWSVERYAYSGVSSSKKPVIKRFLGIFAYTSYEDVYESTYDWKPARKNRYGDITTWSFDGEAVFTSIEAARAAVEKFLKEERELERELKAIEARAALIPPEEYP